MTLIATAVAPERAAAQDRAAQVARDIVARLENDLRAAAWDRQQVAPYPNARTMRPPEYKRGEARYHLVRRLTVRTTTDLLSEGQPEPCELNPAAIERFIQEARDEAAAQYAAFVAKLEGKIGEVSAATLDGSHVWGHSILTVTTAGGDVQRWKTQMIVNVSVLGKVFNQFPTRKLK